MLRLKEALGKASARLTQQPGFRAGCGSEAVLHLLRPAQGPPPCLLWGWPVSPKDWDTP